VSCCVSGCVSGCVASSLLRREEGDNVIDTLTETGDDSRDDVDGHETDTDIGADTEVGTVTDTLIDCGCGVGGCRVGLRCLRKSISD
jgi:hypothetical protein